MWEDIESQVGAAFGEGISGLFSEGKFCDLKVVIDGCTFECHRLVLAAVSKFFLSSLSFQWQEGRTQEVHIYHPDVSVQSFRDLLDVLYLNVYLTFEVAESVLRTAIFLQIDFLEDTCIKFLEKYTPPEACLGVWQMADQYQLGTLAERMIKTALQHLDKVWTCEEFLDLPKELLLILLVEVAQSGVTTLSNTEFLLKVIVRWLEGDWTNRQPHFSELVQLVGLSSVVCAADLMSVYRNISQTCSQPVAQMLQAHVSDLLFSCQRDDGAVNSEHKQSDEQPVTKCVVYFGGCAEIDINECDFHNLSAFRLDEGRRRRKSKRVGQYKYLSEEPLKPDYGCDGHSLPSGEEEDEPGCDKLCVGVTAPSCSLKPLPSDCGLYFASCVWNNELYVSGGSTNPKFFTVYRTKLNKWETLPSLPQGRECHVMEAVNEKIFVIGGLTGEITAHDTLVYSIRTRQWTNCGKLMEASPYSSTGASLGHRIYIFSATADESGLADKEDTTVTPDDNKLNSLSSPHQPDGCEPGAADSESGTSSTADNTARSNTPITGPPGTSIAVAAEGGLENASGNAVYREAGNIDGSADAETDVTDTSDSAGENSAHYDCAAEAKKNNSGDGDGKADGEEGYYEDIPYSVHCLDTVSNQIYYAGKLETAGLKVVSDGGRIYIVDMFGSVSRMVEHLPQISIREQRLRESIHQEGQSSSSPKEPFADLSGACSGAKVSGADKNDAVDEIHVNHSSRPTSSKDLGSVETLPANKCMPSISRQRSILTQEVHQTTSPSHSVPSYRDVASKDASSAHGDYSPPTVDFLGIELDDEYLASKEETRLDSSTGFALYRHQNEIVACGGVLLNRWKTECHLRAITLRTGRVREKEQTLNEGRTFFGLHVLYVPLKFLSEPENLPRALFRFCFHLGSFEEDFLSSLLGRDGRPPVLNSMEKMVQGVFWHVSVQRHTWDEEYLAVYLHMCQDQDRNRTVRLQFGCRLVPLTKLRGKWHILDLTFSDRGSSRQGWRRLFSFEDLENRSDELQKNKCKIMLEFFIDPESPDDCDRSDSQEESTGHSSDGEESRDS